MLDKPELLTTKEVALQYRKHVITVRIALQDGALHGRQRTTGGTWTIERACAEAWSEGRLCAHMLAERQSVKLRRATA